MYEHEPKLQPLTLAFIGCNEDQTRRYFAEFAKMNADQVSCFDDYAGRILLTDGTVIRRVHNNRDHLMGCQFDQVIVAVDRRGVYGWRLERFPLLHEVYNRTLRSCVPDQFLTIVYDLDSEVIHDE